jgi:hypothetical protein
VEIYIDYLIVAIRTKIIHPGGATIWATTVSGSRASTNHRLRRWLRLWLRWLRNRIRNWDRNRCGSRLRRRIGICLYYYYMTHKGEK